MVITSIRFMHGYRMPSPGDIEWNFEKFLINRDGEVIKRYPPQTTPDDAVLLQDISEAL